MNVTPIALASAVILGGMLVALELGRWLGKRQRRADPDAADVGLGAMDGAVFALFGLLVAFTFSGAGARFDHRRDLIVIEANAIGTAYLRVDLLPADAQPELRGSTASTSSRGSPPTGGCRTSTRPGPSTTGASPCRAGSGRRRWPRRSGVARPHSGSSSDR